MSCLPSCLHLVFGCRPASRLPHPWGLRGTPGVGGVVGGQGHVTLLLLLLCADDQACFKQNNIHLHEDEKIVLWREIYSINWSLCNIKHLYITLSLSLSLMSDTCYLLINKLCLERSRNHGHLPMFGWRGYSACRHHSENQLSCVRISTPNTSLCLQSWMLVGFSAYSFFFSLSHREKESSYDLNDS